MTLDTTRNQKATGQQPSTQQPAQQGTSRGGSQAASTTARQQGDRERGIATGREGGGRGLARQQGSQGTGTTGDPLMLMQRMAHDMDRLFEQFGLGRTGFGLTPSLSGLFDEDVWGARPSLVGTERTLWAPQVETFQRGDRLVVRADLPGVRREDLDIEVQDDVLSLSGERRQEHEENREGMYRSERSYGRFYRTIPLPEGVNADECNATFNDGVLEVSFAAPKQEARKSKRIEIR